MPSGPKGLNLSWLGEFFARKYQSRVAALILQWHSGCKRSLASHPTNINAVGGIAPCAGYIKRFVPQRLEHLIQLALCYRPRAVRDNTDDPWQWEFS